ncbi:hypothetical protein [Methylophaga pinxianii]|uniref:hypothetical protein n=1 Tax=Methylophaga pinxianii TaxID=2881052 RepID=UPI001CF21DDC|nr:hypothetical protein [Methylophaga pinxianii]MCB2427471.1 hypothetical protein [Methylophaga pinxianii]UPH44752.1 hypothetical protein LGT42_009520 [Methylophaga pinxianii]
MKMNSMTHDLESWAKHYADQNVFEHNGEIIDSESAFSSAGLHAQAKPSYQDWLASMS